MPPKDISKNATSHGKNYIKTTNKINFGIFKIDKQP